MRIAIDPLPLVLGIYAQVRALLDRALSRAEEDDASELGRRFAHRREEQMDREVQRMVKVVHTEVKTADKLLKKTGDVWKIAGERERVELVVHRRGEDEDPRSYVLLRPDDVREILASVRAAAAAVGEDERTLQALDDAAEGVTGRPSDYYTFGFDSGGG